MKAVIKIKINFAQEINNQTHFFPIKCTATPQLSFLHTQHT